MFVCFHFFVICFFYYNPKCEIHLRHYILNLNIKVKLSFLPSKEIKQIGSNEDLRLVSYTIMSVCTYTCVSHVYFHVTMITLKIHNFELMFHLACPIFICFEVATALFLKNVLLKTWPGSCENLLEMQNQRSHPRHSESESALSRSGDSCACQNFENTVLGNVYISSSISLIWLIRYSDKLIRITVKLRGKKSIPGL